MDPRQNFDPRFLILKVSGILKRHQFLTSPLLDTKVFSASHSIKTFHVHVTQEVKVENEWEFVDLKLQISLCFIFA